MKLTKSKLKEMIKEELLKEVEDLTTPITKAKELAQHFAESLLVGGSSDFYSIEYENNPDKYETIRSNCAKYAKENLRIDNFYKYTSDLINKKIKI